MKKNIESLIETLVPPEVGASSELADCFLSSYRELLEGGDSYSPERAFPALFDFIVTAEYLKRMIADVGWIYCRGDDYSDGASLYFPFLKTCPRCSVHLGKRPAAKSNKPGSDPIGEISSNTTLLLLSKILEHTSPTTQIRKSTDRRGDVDLVISDGKLLILAEVKSSPLVVYPLEVSLSKPMTEVRDGVTKSLKDHSSVTIQTVKDGMSLYIAHRDLRISLGANSVVDWPYPALIKYVSDKSNTALVIEAWGELQDIYSRKGRDICGNIDNRKWITCGCGGRVDDSKNVPGLDRTDDIKKGTYQALKLGAYFKEKVPGMSILAILASNFFPNRTNGRYLEDIKDVLWTKPEYEIDLKNSAYEDEMRVFKKNGVFNLYDAVLCFTGSLFHDNRIEKLFSSKRFLESFLNE
jgi:hypothetical protein